MAAADDIAKVRNYKPYAPEMRQNIIKPADGYEAFLERKYIEIRKTGFYDVPSAAKNTGLTETEIADMKQHIFHDTHKLSHIGMPYEELYFQSNPDIYYTWEKAMTL
jgi:hypothetical protein